jgi:uncharacterized protein (UPF0371 family)
LNIAYEAATVDLKDVNMIDSFHFDAYNKVSINYNRDIETFPILRRIIEKITGEAAVYKSPTDMGVNRVGYGITDDEVIKEASKQEIIRRYFKTSCEYKKGYTDRETVERAKLIMEELNLKEEDRKVVVPARKHSAKLKEMSDKNEVCPTVAIELEDGTILTGKSSDVMNATAAVVLNVVKYLGNISDEIHLISPVILEPIINLKSKTLGGNNIILDCEEILIALSICAVTNPTADVAMEKLSMLKGCQAHSTTILSRNDEQIFRKLGIDVTSDPEYPTESLYYNN